MKVKTVFVVLLLIATVGAVAAQKKSSQADLQKQAKVTKAQATTTALERVPNGKVKEAELENEHGKLVWSFDIATPGSKDITEVQVDAMDGGVVSEEKESPKAEKAEKKVERKSAKPAPQK